MTSLDNELSEILHKVHLGASQDIRIHVVESPTSIQEAQTAILNYFKDVCNEIIGPDEDGETVPDVCPDGKIGCLVYHTRFIMTPEVRKRNNLRAAQRERLQRVVGNVSPPTPKENNEVDK